MISTIEDLKRALRTPKTFKELASLAESNTALVRLRKANPKSIQVYNPPSTWYLFGWGTILKTSPGTITGDLALEFLILELARSRARIAKADKNDARKSTVKVLTQFQQKIDILLRLLDEATTTSQPTSQPTNSAFAPGEMEEIERRLKASKLPDPKPHDLFDE